jgi:hypothetical protein
MENQAVAPNLDLAGGRKPQQMGNPLGNSSRFRRVFCWKGRKIDAKLILKYTTRLRASLSLRNSHIKRQLSKRMWGRTRSWVWYNWKYEKQAVEECTLYTRLNSKRKKMYEEFYMARRGLAVPMCHCRRRCWMRHSCLWISMNSIVLI